MDLTFLSRVRWSGVEVDFKRYEGIGLINFQDYWSRLVKLRIPHALFSQETASYDL